MEYVPFSDGTVHAASLVFTNPKGQAITYNGVFYLAKAATPLVEENPKVVKTFTVPALGSATVLFDGVQMPLLAVASVDYVVCLQILIGSTPIVTFTGNKGVRVTFSPGIGWGGDIIWT